MTPADALTILIVAVMAFAAGYYWRPIWERDKALTTNYRYISADCPEQHGNSTLICPLCGYDPTLPEGERETI